MGASRMGYTIALRQAIRAAASPISRIGIRPADHAARKSVVSGWASSTKARKARRLGRVRDNVARRKTITVTPNDAVKVLGASPLAARPAIEGADRMTSSIIRNPLSRRGFLGAAGAAGGASACAASR